MGASGECRADKAISDGVVKRNADERIVRFRNAWSASTRKLGRNGVEDAMIERIGELL